MDQAESNLGHILIVADKILDLNFLTKILAQPGYHIQVAENGPVALEAIRESPPDLILLDIVLLGIDGDGPAKELKADEQTRDIPLIFVTARGSTQADIARTFAAGGWTM